LTAGAGFIIAVIFSIRIYSHLRPEYAPSVRGLFIARQAGCFTCHARSDSGEVPNPLKLAALQDKRAHLVPDILTSYKKPEVLREWILKGISSGKRESKKFLEQRQKHLLHMPAYEDVLTPGEVDDLVTFLMLERHRLGADEREDLSAGESLARANGCFRCHGELGQGGFSNLQSLKGYIPGFFGKDFDELTGHGDRDEVREWISDGVSKRFFNQGIAGWKAGKYYSDRQIVKMPAYHENRNRSGLTPARNRFRTSMASVAK